MACPNQTVTHRAHAIRVHAAMVGVHLPLDFDNVANRERVDYLAKLNTQTNVKETCNTPTHTKIDFHLLQWDPKILKAWSTLNEFC